MHKVRDVVRLWNENCGEMTKCSGLHQKRVDKIKAMLAFGVDEQTFIKAVQTAANTAFCSGSNKFGWKGTIDWICNPEVICKILEGYYLPRAKSAAIKIDLC